MITTATLSMVIFNYAYLTCLKIDPARIDYCEETIAECIYDEGTNNKEWCTNDYICTEDISGCDDSYYHVPDYLEEE